MSTLLTRPLPLSSLRDAVVIVTAFFLLPRYTPTTSSFLLLLLAHPCFLLFLRLPFLPEMPLCTSVLAHDTPILTSMLVGLDNRNGYGTRNSDPWFWLFYFHLLGIILLIFDFAFHTWLKFSYLLTLFLCIKYCLVVIFPAFPSSCLSTELSFLQEFDSSYIFTIVLYRSINVGMILYSDQLLWC